MAKALAGVDVVYHLAAYQDYLPDFSRFINVNSASTALIYEIIVRDQPARKEGDRGFFAGGPGRGPVPLPEPWRSPAG